MDTVARVPSETKAPKKSSRPITFAGRTQSIRAWCRELGLQYTTVYTRLTELGWSAERALTTPTKVAKSLA